MKNFRIDNMVKGWFVGGFSPTAYHSSSCEVALKKYKKGDCEDAHFHKMATEITLVVSGQIKMVGQLWVEGDIVIVEPGEVSSFEAITDAVNVVVKIPGVLNDKYIVALEKSSSF
jgi:quercetin dioxygenase-like cupin family protein